MTRRRISQTEHARLRRRAVAYARLAVKATYQSVDRQVFQGAAK
jgi:hypothetical protein